MTNFLFFACGTDIKILFWISNQDEKIARMEVELRDCRAELAKEVAAKEKIRRLSIGKLKSALSE